MGWPSWFHDGTAPVDRETDKKHNRMPLSDSLVTNEVKDASGTEIEFSKLDSEGRTKVFAKVGEAPNLQHRLTVKHEEIGIGPKRVRRSLARADYDFVSQTDSETIATASAHAVLTAPVGHMSDTTAAKMVLANLMSFLATTGAGTTVLFDCTGTGAKALLNGES